LLYIERITDVPFAFATLPFLSYAIRFKWDLNRDGRSSNCTSSLTTLEHG